MKKKVIDLGDITPELNSPMKVMDFLEPIVGIEKMEGIILVFTTHGIYAWGESNKVNRFVSKMVFKR